MTILELLEMCKKHDIIAEFKYLDFAECYKISLEKESKHKTRHSVVKLISEDEIEKAMIDPEMVVDLYLKNAFEELGVDICE